MATKYPSWKHRRSLIYASYLLGTVMVIFGAVTYRTDSQVSSQLIVGGVSLVTIILTAYTAFATLDDRWHPQKDDAGPYEGDSVE